MLRVIFFDLDETLVDQEAAFEEAYRSTAEWLSREVIRVDPTILATKIPLAAQRALSASPLAATLRRCCFGGRDLLWGNPGTGAGATQTIKRHIEAFRTAAWSALLQACSADSGSIHLSVAAELNRRFRADMFAALRLHADVRPALERLAPDYSLAVITNGMGAAQREKIAHLKIDEHFRAVIASAEIGAGKPAGQIFDSATRALDVRASESLMIGDSLEGDIEGARSAGMRATWLSRPSRLDGYEHPPPGNGSRISGLTDWSPSDVASPTRTSSEAP